MSDLISRQAAIAEFTCCELTPDGGIDANYAIDFLEQMPSAQPERKKGEWQITDAYPHNVYCSECHTRFAQTHWAVWEDGSLPRIYCPNCGADMRGGKDDER